MEQLKHSLTDEWEKKIWYVYNIEISFIIQPPKKQKRNSVICDNRNEPRGRYAKENKSHTYRQVLSSTTYIQNLKQSNSGLHWQSRGWESPASAGDMGCIHGLGRSRSLGAGKPVHHNYWARALEPTGCNYWAPAPRAVLRKRSHHSEGSVHCN